MGNIIERDTSSYDKCDRIRRDSVRICDYRIEGGLQVADIGYVEYIALKVLSKMC